MSTRVVHQIAAWCLSYPDQDLLARLPLLTDALAEQAPGPQQDRLARLVAYLGSRPLEELEKHYVEVFDLSRKHALYLSYWTDGDTRRRGAVLGAFKQRYRDSGWLVDTGGELTDFLPLVLEYAALADPDDGIALLQEYRASVELLKFALIEADSPYALAVEAICATLPGVSPADKQAVHAMAAAGPPSELVGLDGVGDLPGYALAPTRGER
jgi:nitrate reductase delta subunit